MRKKILLSFAEKSLWRQVTKDADPFWDLPPLEDTEPTETEKKEEIKNPEFMIKPKARPAFGRGTGIDKNTEEKLRRGKMQIDGTLDLHGYTQTEAFAALQGFVLASVKRNKRCLLIVTGKGRGGEGILRQAVPRWLKEPDIAQYILSVQMAKAKDGGEGALYVLLRRNRAL